VSQGYRSVFRGGLFASQVAVVTGGGSGIGRCIAHELSSLGARLALVGRKSDKLDAVKAEIAAAGGEADAYPCDIREEERVRETVAAILRRFGRIDHLVNNAGGQFAAPLAAISQKGFETVVRTNLTGGFLVARECFTQWMEGHGGAIVNIIADMWNGMPGMGHSGAARAGMMNFTETAALEWSGANVRVNAVAPGWIASSGLDNYPPEMREHIRNLKKLSPMGRIGTESAWRSRFLHHRRDLARRRRRAADAPQPADAQARYAGSGVRRLPSGAPAQRPARLNSSTHQPCRSSRAASIPARKIFAAIASRCWR
jgi:citronellol/citronellal dehydrogenase